MPDAESARDRIAADPRLAGYDPLGHGANRVVVRDPADPGCCLKFELPEAGRTTVGTRARLRRRLACLLPRLGENATELRAWRRLRSRLGEDALRGRVAPCHGIVATPAGPALRCGLVRGADGRPAASLYALLAGTGRWSQDALCAAVDDFEAWLRIQRVPLFDLNAGNFVVVEAGGRPRLVCVDAKSTLSGKELLPFARWIPALGRRKQARRAARLRARIRAALAPDTPPGGTGAGSAGLR